MLQHEFIKSTKIPIDIIFSSFQKDQFLIISDDFILEYCEHFKKPMMYANDLGTPCQGISYWGISIFDQKASKEMLAELKKIPEDQGERDKLIALFEQAIDENAYVIHFGI